LKNLLLLFFLFISIITNAQEYVDVLKLGYGYANEAKYKDTEESTTINSYNAAITFPVELNEKYALITGIDFSSNHLLLSPDYNQSTTLYNTLLKVGLATTHSEKWSSTLVLLPKIASDYKNLSGDDFYFGVYAVAKLKKSKHFKYRFGFYASTEAFGVFATPIIGAYYLSPNNRFEIDASLPITANVNYKFGKAAIGFDYFAIGRSFNISQETSIPVYVDQRPIEIASYFQYGILENSILLRVKMGYSSNTNEVYKQGDTLDFRVSAFSFGDNRTQLNPDILGSVFFKVEAIYRIHFEKKEKETIK
tara:strand:- start:67763 stop:68683 length:921 start_codon:yes stop_codon:yes gene_type:complete